MTSVQAPTSTSAKSRYVTLSKDRAPYLDRARLCSALTIPALMPPDGHSAATDLPQPWQSVGSRGINCLTNKLLLSLFPAEISFFKLAPNQEVADSAADAGVELGEVQLALAKAERIVLEDIETSGDRASLFEALRQLLNTGNALLHSPTDGPTRLFRLDRYAVKRDLSGNVIECVVEELTAYAALAPEHRALIPDTDASKTDYINSVKDVAIYTRIWRDGSRMLAIQEISGVPVPGSDAHWPIELCPWHVLRMIACAGEDYGRSYIEEYLGDLTALDRLQKAIVEGSLLAALHFTLVKPNGVTRKRDIEKAQNGDVITGSVDDVGVAQAGKYGDLSIAGQTAQRIENRLEFAFLMNSAIQRQAERVTAEEIRFMAEELDATLGGVYTVLSQELQLPYVRLKIAKLQKQKTLPKWPSKSLRVRISTGLDAIGRGRDIARMDRLIGDAVQTFGPDVAQKYVIASEWFRRRAASLAIDPAGLIRSEEEVAAEAAQQQQTQSMDNVAPELVRQGGNMLQDAIAPQPQQ